MRNIFKFRKDTSDLEQAAKIIADKQLDLMMMDLSTKLESIDRFYRDTFVTKNKMLIGLHFNANNELIKMINSLLKA